MRAEQLLETAYFGSAALFIGAGLVLFSKAAGVAAIVLARTGMAMLIWTLAWHFLAMADPTVWLGGNPDGQKRSTQLLLNVALSTIAWFPALIFAALTKLWGHCDDRLTMLFMVLWFVGLILPHLGQGGLWPLSSIILLLWSVALTFILGAMTFSRSIRFGNG